MAGAIKSLLIIVAVVIALVAVVFFVRSRIAPTYRVSVRDIPQVITQLSASRSPPAFAAFILVPPDRPDQGEAVNLQFSIENGRVGFDWVLLAPPNIRDQERFIAFARASGFAPSKREENNVQYLRVEDGDLATLCSEIVTKMYGWPENEPFDMITEGFVWER